MAEKCQDDEFVLQVAWAFARAFSLQPTCTVLLTQTHVRMGREGVDGGVCRLRVHRSACVHR
jgi:hypothetical protein